MTLHKWTQTKNKYSNTVQDSQHSQQNHNIETQLCNLSSISNLPRRLTVTLQHCILGLFSHVKWTLRWDWTSAGPCWQTDPLLTRGETQSLESNQVHSDRARPNQVKVDPDWRKNKQFKLLAQILSLKDVWYSKLNLLPVQIKLCHQHECSLR